MSTASLTRLVQMSASVSRRNGYVPGAAHTFGLPHAPHEPDEPDAPDAPDEPKAPEAPDAPDAPEAPAEVERPATLQDIANVEKMLKSADIKADKRRVAMLEALGRALKYDIIHPDNVGSTIFSPDNQPNQLPDLSAGKSLPKFTAHACHPLDCPGVDYSKATTVVSCANGEERGHKVLYGRMGTEEETMCRTTLYARLNADYGIDYPRANGSIWLPRVAIVNKNRDKLFQLADPIIYTNVISVVADYDTELDEDGSSYADNETFTAMATTIRSMLAKCVEKEQKTIVISIWPGHSVFLISYLWVTLILAEFIGYFDNIVFALDNDPDKNVVEDVIKTDVPKGKANALDYVDSFFKFLFGGGK